MRPPTKFHIMRINRGFTEYVNRKQELVAEIDSCELHVLRTLQKGQLEEEYPTAQRIAAAMQTDAGPSTFVPISAPPLPEAAPVQPPQPRRGFVSRLFAWGPA